MYTPKIIDRKYVLFAAKCIECPVCKKLMVKKLTNECGSFFPEYAEHNQDSQMRNAKLVCTGSAKVDDEYVCVECEKAGLTDFMCELCGKRKSTEKIHETIGHPADFLCKDCYKTCTAEVWDNKCDELIDLHMYDYE